MKVILRIENSTVVNEIPLDANTGVVIGRSSRSDFKVIDEIMSGTHCKITLIPPRLELQDLESKMAHS